jgi:hypothetical protein
MVHGYNIRTALLGKNIISFAALEEARGNAVVQVRSHSSTPAVTLWPARGNVSNAAVWRKNLEHGADEIGIDAATRLGRWQGVALDMLDALVLIMDRDGPDDQGLVITVLRKVEMPRRGGILHREESPR